MGYSVIFCWLNPCTKLLRYCLPIAPKACPACFSARGARHGLSNERRTRAVPQTVLFIQQYSAACSSRIQFPLLTRTGCQPPDRTLTSRFRRLTLVADSGPT